MFHSKNDKLEVLLVHPGGPFFAKKGEGAWTIPKGEPVPGEDLLIRARIEFEEELGVRPHGNWITQKGGKVVHASALEGDLPESLKPQLTTCKLECPPR